MNRTALTRELIADPTLWRLILRVDPAGLRALLIGPESVERSVLSHSETLTDASVKALENAVYDNPLLLSDFAGVDIIFSTPGLFLAPRGTETLREEMADAMLPDSDGPRTILSEPVAATDAEVCFAADSGRLNFLTRTFATAAFHHSLAVDASYLAHRNAAGADAAHLYALCEGPGEMAVIAFGPSGRPVYLNRPQPAGAPDAAYYILAPGLRGTPMSVGGEPELRNAVCALLRRVDPTARVLPLTLDEDLLHLRRLAPDATFDMIFLTKL